jgi:hypothetical protein
VTRRTRGRRYARFLGLAVAIVAALMGIGYVPTSRLAGDGALAAMFAGSAISLAGAALAAWVLVAVQTRTPTERLQTAFLAMVVRLVVALALGLAAALGGGFQRAPLLFWLAATYVVLLPLEVSLAIEPE